MIFATRLASLLAFLGLAPAVCLAQMPGRHVTDYTISLAGFTIARANFNAVLRETDYSIAGEFHTAGIAGLITTISGETSSEGRLSRGRLMPSDYRLVYRKGERSRIYDVTMRNGSVTRSTIEPPVRRDPATWIPVRAAHLRQVIDPLAGLLLPSEGKVCNGSLPVYDGETRMDIVLSDEGSRSFSIGRKRIDAVACSARYVPKAGFRRGRKDVEYLRKAAMEIWFAKSDTVDLYAPVYVRIPTGSGTLTISATRFGK